MTWTAQGQAPVHFLAYHLDDSKIRLQVATSVIDLTVEQRRGLAEYLIHDLPPVTQ